MAETKKKVTAKKAKPKPKVKSKAKPSAKPKGNGKNTTDMNGYLPNLITLFKDNISPALQKQLGLSFDKSGPHWPRSARRFWLSPLR